MKKFDRIDLKTVFALIEKLQRSRIAEKERK
jgi:hypothetical protein